MNTELSKQTKKAKLLPDHINAMLAYWDSSLVCRYANIAYLDWFGISPGAMIDKMELKDLLGPLFQQNLPYIEAALNGKTQTFEREIPAPKGGFRYSLANYYPDIENNQVKGFFVHVADITPLKLAEKELMRKNALLTEQNSRLFNFAYIVTHNLKSYSGNLIGVLDMYDQSKSSVDRKVIISFLREIANGFQNTIDNLNQIVHAQSLISVAHENTDLHEYAEKAIDNISIQVKASKALINNTIPKNTWVCTNPAYLESILSNLLTNAIKYRHPERRPKITIEYLIENEYHVLSITDNGLGINLKKHKDKLFGMFKTFHGNTDAKGIGLFLTKFQIESMGGKIEVESKEHSGTTFRVYFVK